MYHHVTFAKGFVSVPVKLAVNKLAAKKMLLKQVKVIYNKIKHLKDVSS